MLKMKKNNTIIKAIAYISIVCSMSYLLFKCESIIITTQWITAIIATSLFGAYSVLMSYYKNKLRKLNKRLVFKYNFKTKMFTISGCILFIDAIIVSWTYIITMIKNSECFSAFGSSIIIGCICGVITYRVITSIIYELNDVLFTFKEVH